jgi:hypothetical protein
MDFTATITWLPAHTPSADALLDLAGDDHGTVVSLEGEQLVAILTVDGPTPTDALASAIDHCLSAHPGTLAAAEIATTVEHDRRLALDARPQLVGLSEIAEQLGVTRQRANTLRRSRSDFPDPAAELRAGPVWFAADVTRFVETWSRRPGRPPSTSPTT